MRSTICRYALLCAVFMPVLMVSAFAQTSIDYEVPLNDDLVKVCSEGKYGVRTVGGSIIVPVEYDNFAFSDDSLAVLTKNGNEIWGSVGLDGVAHFFEKTTCKTVQNKAYFSEGYIVVQYKNGKYMFMNREGDFLKVRESVQNVWFDTAETRPFLNGYASGRRIKDNAWYHVDKNGRRRFIFTNGVSLFRSAVHDNNGKMECVIYAVDTDHQTVYLCQEDPLTHHANFKQTLGSYSLSPEPEYDSDRGWVVTKFPGSANNLVLYSDAKGRVFKYTRDDKGEVYLIEEARPVVKQEEAVAEDVL